MNEKNAVSRNPIFKITKKIKDEAELHSWTKTGVYGITSIEPVNGSRNFELAIMPCSAEGHVSQRQTPSEPTTELICYIRFLVKENVWSEWFFQFQQGEVGPAGADGADGPPGIDGANGVAGLNAYEFWLTLPGNAGKSSAEYMAAIKGDPGAAGVQGETGIQGIQGLKGDKGDTGAQGIQGIQGVAGADGITPDLSDYLTKIEAGTTYATLIQMGDVDASLDAILLILAAI